MALEGQLSDFNLAEILQLIATQQKSGFLNLDAHRNMVFIFDKGVLISTRDRRDKSRDPLESFLRAYGFFNDSQWKHIGYVKGNSSLDLTEILVSEGMLSDEELIRVLKCLAQEMAHQGMKLRRGRYHFSPTKDSPHGIRGRFRLDVQGLLMEAARRLDEESGLREALPSQAITFSQGGKAVPVDGLTPTSKRIMKLALAGLPLGRIVRQGRVESFVARDILKTWCDEKILVMHLPGDDDEDEQDGARAGRKIRFNPGLKSLTLTVMAVLMLGAVGYLRWFSVVEFAPHSGQDLRQSQLRAEVIEAARLYRYGEGNWPESLGELVRKGQLDPATQATVESLGWKYDLNRKEDRFSLGA